MEYLIPEIDIKCVSIEKTIMWNKYPRHEYHFENNFGASVIHNPYSYGLEVAVLVFKPQVNRWEITYDTNITDDVVGYIDGKDGLKKLLTKISQLEKEN